MAYNYPQQGPFWDFIHGLNNNNNNNNNNGAGVDHQIPNSFPFFGPQGAAGGHPPPPPPPPPPFGVPFEFGYGPFGQGHPFGHRGYWGRGGRRGRWNRHDRNGSHERTPSNDREGPMDGEQAEGENRETREGSPHGGRRGESPHAHRGPHGGRHGRHGYRGSWGGPRGFGGAGGFDLSALMESLGAHPVAQAFRAYAEQAAAQGQRSGETMATENDESFTPPIDVFSTPGAYVLHVALPGAKKEDVGVNWDAEKGVLNLAGVVYRKGDEEFLKSLAQGERKVGMFERTIKLPLPGHSEEKEEVDGDSITAKLEDGVLVVTVPKLEREWTEVKRVDIE